MEKKKVLLVDDEVDFTRLVKTNLETTDKFEVMTLNSAKDILTYVHQFAPDVILLDLLMPVIGGMEVCEILNNDPIGKRIPVIIISALDKETDKLKAYKLGVVAYLTKPMEVDDIIHSIEKVLKFR
jgi:CheY-like chemotaxis protein